MACAVIFTAPFAMGPDQPIVTVAKNPPIHSRLAVAITKVQVVAVNPPPMHLAENPPVIMPPVVADPSNPPSAATGPAEAAAQVRPASTDTAQETGTPNAPVIAANPARAEALPPAFDRRILAVHNRERQNLGLEPLSWNQALAQSAKQWAEHLAATGRFEHAPENRSTPEGENLWAGTKGYYPPEAMVDAWIREKKFFRPGLFPANSVTGRVEDIGHYTQVVWRATRQVGCAQAASANEDILVCRYAEAGNYRGEQPF